MEKITECYCGEVEGGKALVCHIHYKALIEDSNLQFSEDKNPNIEYIGNIPIIRTKDKIRRSHVGGK
jgi:hypothetical protein